MGPSLFWLTKCTCHCQSEPPVSRQTAEGLQGINGNFPSRLCFCVVEGEQAYSDGLIQTANKDPLQRACA